MLLRNFLRDEDMPDIAEMLSAELQAVYLGANSLTVCPDFRPFPQLRVLHLNNNSLTRMHSLGGLAHLQELDLRSNQINSLAGFPALPELVWVSLACNQLRSLEGLPLCARVKYVGLFGNYLVSLEETVELLGGCCEALEEAFLSGNGWDDLPEYQEKVVRRLRLRKLDGQPVLA